MIRIFPPAFVVSTFTSARHSWRQSRRRQSIYFRIAARSRQNLPRVVSVVLVVSLLATSTPAAPQTIVALAKESSVSLGFWFQRQRMAEGCGAITVRVETQTPRNKRSSEIAMHASAVLRSTLAT